MNLFLVAISPRPIEPEAVATSLGTVASRLPYFNAQAMRQHVSADRRVVTSWIAHSGDLVGGVNYAASEGDVVVFYSGRPILVADHVYDGVGPLNPSLYLRRSRDWEHHLDGRYVIVRCEGGREVTVTTDSTRAYRTFTTEHDGIRWIGNNAEAVAIAGHAYGLDSLALASLLSFGWCLGGRPVRSNVHRLAPNATHTFRSDPSTWTTEFRRDVMTAVPARFDAREAAGVLSGVTRALMQWPSRPVTVGVTGGRDSRLTFAAAAQSLCDFHAKTITSPQEAGFPNSADVRVARKLCQLAGVRHSTEIGSQAADVRRSTNVLSLMASASISSGDVGSPPLELPEGPLELQVTGAGGEIARCYYGAGFETAFQASEAVFNFHVPMLPPPIVNESALDLVRQWVRRWSEERAEQGVSSSALGDAFYLEERMGSWAAAGHGVYEYWADTVSPLWAASLSPLMLACPAHLRRRDGFHNLVLRELSPELWQVKFGGNMPNWLPLEDQRAQVERINKAARKLRRINAEVLRRLELRLRHDRSQSIDSIVEAQALARELVSASPGHDAWSVLNPRRVARVLSADPRAMHPRSRHQIWRILAVFATADRPLATPSAREVDTGPGS